MSTNSLRHISEYGRFFVIPDNAKQEKFSLVKRGSFLIAQRNSYDNITILDEGEGNFESYEAALAAADHEVVLRTCRNFEIPPFEWHALTPDQKRDCAWLTFEKNSLLGFEFLDARTLKPIHGTSRDAFGLEKGDIFTEGAVSTARQWIKTHPELVLAPVYEDNQEITFRAVNDIDAHRLTALNYEKVLLDVAGYRVAADADQPGMFVWIGKDGGCDVSLESEEAAHYDALKHIKSGLSEMGMTEALWGAIAPARQVEILEVAQDENVIAGLEEGAHPPVILEVALDHARQLINDAAKRYGYAPKDDVSLDQMPGLQALEFMVYPMKGGSAEDPFAASMEVLSSMDVFAPAKTKEAVASRMASALFQVLDNYGYALRDDRSETEAWVKRLLIESYVPAARPAKAPAMRSPF